MANEIELKYISFIGDSGSGKTASILAIQNILTAKGVYPIILKNSHHFSQTEVSPNKDTSLFRKDKSPTVGIGSNKEIAFFIEGLDSPLKRLQFMMKSALYIDTLLENERKRKRENSQKREKQENISGNFRNSIKNTRYLILEGFRLPDLTHWLSLSQYKNFEEYSKMGNFHKISGVCGKFIDELDDENYKKTSLAGIPIKNFLEINDINQIKWNLMPNKYYF